MFRDLLTMLYQCLVELVEARPGIGISAFRRFLPAVSKQTFAMIFFDILPAFSRFTSLAHLYTGTHSSSQLFARFLRFFKFSRLLHSNHDIFRRLNTGWSAGPHVAKCRQMHIFFATTGDDPAVHEPRDHVRRY